MTKNSSILPPIRPLHASASRPQARPAHCARFPSGGSFTKDCKKLQNNATQARSRAPHCAAKDPFPTPSRTKTTAQRHKTSQTCKPQKTVQASPSKPASRIQPFLPPRGREVPGGRRAGLPASQASLPNPALSPTAWERGGRRPERGPSPALSPAAAGRVPSGRRWPKAGERASLPLSTRGGPVYHG
jgi:hypothetical protein